VVVVHSFRRHNFKCFYTYFTIFYEYLSGGSSRFLSKTQAGGGVRNSAALGELGTLGNSFNSVENEIEVLSSRAMSNVVDELSLDVQYFDEGQC
jgi:hypothetical protein